jgi:hypothetical protein
MATETRKILGQSALAATTLTDVYTVPAATQCVNSSVFICNQSGANRTFRVSLAVAGLADTAKQYIYYNESLPKDTTFVFTTGITFGATDVIRVYASGTGVSVNVLGVEIA